MCIMLEQAHSVLKVVQFLMNKHPHAMDSMAKLSDEALSAVPSLPVTWWEIKNLLLGSHLRLIATRTASVARKALDKSQGE